MSRELEPRSFASEARVGELAHIDPEGLTLEELVRAAVRGVHQTHGCLETHIHEQNKVNAEIKLAHLDATEKRVALAGDLLSVKEDVSALALALGVKKPAEGEAKPKGHALATWGPGRVATALSGMGVSVLVLAKVADKVAPDVWALVVKTWGLLVDAG